MDNPTLELSSEMSIPALQRVFHGSKSYIKNTDKKYSELTQLVITYKEKASQDSLKQIMKLSHNLVFTVMNQYNMFKLFPEEVTEEIAGDCHTFVLLKCIDTFDITRKASFSTHYVWWLKSHMNYKRDYYNRRINLIRAESVHRWNNQEDLEHQAVDNISTMNLNTMVRVKREIRNYIADSSI